jgi:hypothetical protein
MRSTYLIAGAIVLALVAAGVLFGTDFFRKNPFGPSEKELLAQLNGVTTAGGYAATFADPAASTWRLAQGHRLERFSLNDDGAVFARLTSDVPLNKETWDWATQGLSWSLPVTFNNKSNGKKIEIGIVARQSQANGADALYLAYATHQAGNSGWHKIDLGGSFRLSTFVFDVPKLEPGAYTAQPILVMHADPSGTGKSAEILGAYVKTVAE